MRQSKPLKIIHYWSTSLLCVCQLNCQRSAKILELLVECETDGGHERQSQKGNYSAEARHQKKEQFQRSIGGVATDYKQNATT